VLPASSEPLQCKLWIADLIAGRGVAVSGTPDIVTYNALSYSWGSGSPTGRVICNSVEVLVNDTLASALRVLRHQQKEIHIWCDVLCIYSYRTATKCCRNLRFRPQFCEGFDSNPQKPVRALGAPLGLAFSCQLHPPTRFS
jgi:hypothetical protein